MRILFSDITTLSENGTSALHQYVVTDGERIAYIGDTRPEGPFDRVISGRDRLLMPALYNCHSHAAMTLFRGYGEDLPLQSWLNDRIFPAEDLLTSRSVYDGSMLAAAEMLANGVVSFSDMYFFCEDTVRAVDEIGMKANVSRCIVCFDPTSTREADTRMQEAEALYRQYHNLSGGRIKIDMSLHAEYTVLPNAARYVAEFAKAEGLSMQVHLSETEREHRECMERNGGKTPAEYFADLGVFDVPTTAAHCVYVTEGDIAILRDRGVTVAHNPVSNLKLGSGVMPMQKLFRAGVNVTFGTDGAASNNRLDVLREMNLAAILQKGTDRVCDAMHASDFLPMATVNGARAQGRGDCGQLAVGCKADLTVLSMDTVNNIPCYDPCVSVLYSATGRDVYMTMADGRILYEGGNYTTIDIEAVKYRMRETVIHYFDGAKG